MTGLAATGMNPKKRPRLTIQRSSVAAHVPSDAQFQRWASVALDESSYRWEVALRIVGATRSRRINARYRGVDRPTNVLSFRTELPEKVRGELERVFGARPLGDLVICAPLVQAEARRQRKRTADHWAHLLVHGILHLLGHDHEDSAQADEMEGLEREILARMGIADPYADPANAENAP